MICNTEQTNLKTDIGEKIGEKIIIKGSTGRGKFFEREAIIEKTYPNVFSVRYLKWNRTETYQYKDILQRVVDVQVFNGEEYCPLIPAVNVEKNQTIKDELNS